ncbi:MAG: hypothetical protein A2015_17240 [Spirochaetes bacterium GWF1_31_7]|nr:MAG: hypothetical protein A2Y30_09990 [Spirochaetes bacterium GWE1_32_154]OHD46501.1 MAG: hypothetical protein A2Y29_04120 [Spirochaetes bacterium GWE2_31_10]OHD46734.1 MAG: hypothetical protein A2015_17240 [Spirochaetes bacterium GWF1_31_7]OHD83031.1 MAG: hypothetical protein A2355_18155 [Spirochaetes bacterium RIFOXYB1_FULL_32_8]HBD92858.1 hypothetical protein [Spirochaetia bacterium]
MLKENEISLVKIKELLKKVDQKIVLSFEEKVCLLESFKYLCTEEYNVSLDNMSIEEVANEINTLISEKFIFNEVIDVRINFLIIKCNQIINELSNKNTLDDYLFSYNLRDENEKILREHFNIIKNYYLAIEGIIGFFDEIESEYEDDIKNCVS